jgi:hypothetical protein
MATERSVRTSSETAAGSCSRNVGSSLDSVDDLHDVRARLFLDGQVDRALAAVPRHALVVLDAVVDVRHLVEPHRVAVAVGDDHGAVRGGAHQLAAGLHDVGLVRAVNGSGRQVDVVVRDRRRELVEPDAMRRQLVGVGVDPHRVLRGAEHVDLRHAADHRDALRDRALGVLVDGRHRQRGRTEHQEEDRLIVRVHLLVRRRRRHLRRQLARRLRDHRVDVLRRGVDVAAQVELQRDVRAALRAGGVDRVEAGDCRELLLERQRDGDAIVSGLAPGRPAPTWMVGKSTVGRSLTGSCWYDSVPKTMIPSMISAVVTGRLMKRAARFMTWPCPPCS